ncbi:jg13465 [Pararge aegeria aegeria]|uniref:Jg13465 protein n=1 Tax=Pararge aegeria aegeria TaxID=348720 RepID=A0A8S4RJU4_9NEOP|nr:jg13465 [Pararge aegeria aegeria]
MPLSEEQFKTLLEAVGGGTKKGSFAACTTFYEGERESNAVEAFLAAVSVYKEVERISDEDAITGLPLVLKKDAATWWQGVKEGITQWSDFKKRLRHAFAPKKPAYIIYQELIGVKQEHNEHTEKFIAQKRMLLAQLPKPEHTEEQQLDMIFGQLKLSIKEKVPRTSIKTFDELLDKARAVEEVSKDREFVRADRDTNLKEKKGFIKRERCNFCKLMGHKTEECRKKLKAEQNLLSSNSSAHTPKKPIATTSSQVPSPTAPKFSCYGCGTPGVVRSNCETCTKPKPKVPDEEIGFNSVNVQTDSRSRPVIYIEIEGITGTAYIDTCAKSSVASFELYCRLKNKGYHFEKANVWITLADGHRRKQDVLTVKALVTLDGRTIPTTFIVLPNSRENKTLLGVGFIQDARMLLNMAQFTYQFLDDPYIEHELYKEDFAVFNRSILMDNLHSPVVDTERAYCPLSNISERNSDLTYQITESAATPTDSSIPYRLRRLDSPEKKIKTFDGYSPRFADAMMRDAQINVHRMYGELELSPESASLFPNSYTNIDIAMLEVDFTNTVLENSQKEALKQLLDTYEDIFTSNGQPTTIVEHCIETINNTPISVPPYRLSPPRKEILRKKISEMLNDGIIEPCASPWAAPVIMIPKPNKEVRLCLDYRRLNAVTIPDNYPMPRMDDLLHEAKPTPFMTTLDLKARVFGKLKFEMKIRIKQHL